MRALLLAATLLALVHAGASAQMLDRAAIYAANKQAVVRVTVTGRDVSGQPVEKRSGTGVMVRANGAIATSLTLVGRDEDWFESGGARERTIEVSAPDGNGVERSLGRASAMAVPSRDLAILRITGENFREASLDANPPSQLASVVAVIWEPDRSPAEPVTGDLVPTDAGRYGDALTIRLPLIDGFPGAGVFNASGNLIGIISKKLDGTRVLAVPVYALAGMLPPPPRVRRTEADVAQCEVEVRGRRVERQPFSVGASVRCESMGDTKDGVASFSAPPGFTIAGQVGKADETNYGQVGEVRYDSEGERVTTARATLHRATPNRPFGPGGWAGTTLSGFIERMLSGDDLNQIRQECLNR